MDTDLLREIAGNGGAMVIGIYLIICKVKEKNGNGSSIPAWVNELTRTLSKIETTLEAQNRLLEQLRKAS